MAADGAAAHIAAAEEHYDHHRSLGLSNEKMGMWTFLASEVTFFGSLFTIYILYMGRHGAGPTQAEIFDIPFTAGMTLILMLSSVALVLALGAIRAGMIARFQMWTLGAALLGTVFLAAMLYEYTLFFLKDFTFTTSPFSSAFYILTGFHGLHVAIGIIMLVALWGASASGRMRPERHDVAENISLYWHFVDLVWILIFAVVYLIPAI
jgi:heme/copper-type cytochrome/quinol oxidase subunit 3